MRTQVLGSDAGHFGVVVPPPCAVLAEDGYGEVPVAGGAAALSPVLMVVHNADQLPIRGLLCRQRLQVRGRQLCWELQRHSRPRVSMLLELEDHNRGQR